MRTPGLYDAPLSEAGPPKPDEEAGVDDVLREALTLEAPPPDDLAQPSWGLSDTRFSGQSAGIPREGCRGSDEGEDGGNFVHTNAHSFLEI